MGRKMGGKMGVKWGVKLKKILKPFVFKGFSAFGGILR